MLSQTRAVDWLVRLRQGETTLGLGWRAGSQAVVDEGRGVGIIDQRRTSRGRR